MTHAEGRWTACPPGEFTRLGARLRGRRQRRHALRAATAAAVLLGGMGIWALQTGPREYHCAGISCSRVQDLVMAYAEGDLSPNLEEQVRSHAEQCPRCHELFEEMGLLSALVLPDLARVSLGWLASSGIQDHRKLHAPINSDGSPLRRSIAGQAG